jgi:hypothetical protein
MVWTKCPWINVTNITYWYRGRQWRKWQWDGWFTVSIFNVLLAPSSTPLSFCRSSLINFLVGFYDFLFWIIYNDIPSEVCPYAWSCLVSCWSPCCAGGCAHWISPFLVDLVFHILKNIRNNEEINNIRVLGNVISNMF